MNRLNLATLLLGVLLIAGCKKNATEEKALPKAADTRNVNVECQPPMFSLVVDPSSGASYIFKVAGSPSAGPVNVGPYIISGSNLLTDCFGNAIKFATGLAYDPSTGVFYGTTGLNSSPVNTVFSFTDPNCVTFLNTVSTCNIALNLSDLERDPTSGRYYAINRGTTNPNNRVVQVAISSTAANILCLPNPLPLGLNLRGLTFDCNGQLYVMHTSGATGVLVAVNKVSGLNTATYTYPGPIAPGASVAAPELGLHFDCDCIKRFITGGYDPTTLAPLMTDGLPAGLGGPVYSSLSGAMKPTVDFARVQ